MFKNKVKKPYNTFNFGGGELEIRIVAAGVAEYYHLLIDKGIPYELATEMAREMNGKIWEGFSKGHGAY